MSVFTKLKFGDVVASDGEKIRNRSGHTMMELSMERTTNSHLVFGSFNIEDPMIRSAGSSSDVGMRIETKGSSSLTISSSNYDASILIKNQSGYGFGIKPSSSSNREFFFIMPSDLPSELRSIGVNSNGELAYVDVGGTITISSQTVSATGHVSTTAISGLDFRVYEFGRLKEFNNYHQGFLNGILQNGIEVGDSSALLIASSQADYMYSEDRSFYFYEEHMSDDDTITAYAKFDD